MNDEEQKLMKRFSELARRSDDRRCTVWSDFLTLSEQDTLLKMRLPAPVTLFGGFDAAERRMARFGQPDGDGIPIVCVYIAPVSKKFAEVLSHRDVLGTLMGLGLRREMLGDIVLDDGEAYLFCADTVAGYVVEQLDRIRHTTVRCEIADAPSEVASAAPEEKLFTVASERLDALVASVLGLSRAESQTLVSQQKVFINGRITESLSFSPKAEDIISVRGYGRFVYYGVRGETKKGRLRVAAGVY